ncbi:MAG: hypothetical protein K2L01_00220 [Rikenellaceae bacterium]|nr:hypothetical protein [Rikenellaceae bacterium]
MNIFSRIIAMSLVALPCVCGAAPADTLRGGSAPRASVRLMPDTITIGDRFVMRVTVDKDLMQQIVFPDLAKAGRGDTVELVSVGNIDTVARDGRRLTIALDYTMTCFEPGLFGLGRVPVLYGDKNVTDTLYTDAEDAVLLVKGFDIDTLAQTIADIKPVRQTPFTFRELLAYLTTLPVLLSLAGVLLVVAAVLLWRRYGRRRVTDGDVCDEPAHERAIRELERLSEEKLWQNGRVKEYYTRLSDIVRDYIARRYGFPALETTTPELVERLRRMDVDRRECDRAGELLALSDLVKFAKYIPPVERHRELYDEAYIFVEETKEMPAAEDEAADTQN